MWSSWGGGERKRFKIGRLAIIGNATIENVSLKKINKKMLGIITTIWGTEVNT